MIKKLILLICALSMMIMPCNISYAAASISEEEAVLDGVGILNDDIQTYDGFVMALAEFLYENPEQMGSAEDIARYTGMLSLNDSYKGTAKITYGDAAKFAVVALGYDLEVEQNGGGVSSYINKAGELGLLDGISGKAESKASRDKIVVMLYNMLSAHPMQKKYNGADDEYVVLENSTLLEINRNITKINGLMTSTEFASIYGEKGTNKSNLIAIDENIYTIDGKNFDDLLGYNIEAYVQTKDMEDAAVLYMRERPSKNKTLEIDAEDIEKVADDFSTITYYNESDKAKDVKLEGAVRVIYNGVYYDQYTADDLKPECGNLRFIDNDANGKYDVMFVTAYETIVVDTIDADDQIIANKYDFDGSIGLLKTEHDNVTVYDTEGNVTTLSAIKIDDVLSVAKSKGDTERTIKIYISPNGTVQGKVTGYYSEDDTVAIDGSEYEESADFKKYLEKEGKTVTVGKECIFYLDYFGNIAYMKQAPDSDYKVVQKIYTDDVGDQYFIVYMDMLGEWYTTPLAEKVSLNGAAKASAATVCNKISLPKPEIMKMKFNAKNEVVSIETPKVGVVDEDELTKVPEATYMYRSPTKSFDVSVFLSNNAKIVCVPQDSANKAGYTIRDASGFFSGDTSYTVTLYDVSEYSITPLIMFTETDSSKDTLMSKAMMIVTAVGERYVDGEILPTVEGYRGKFEEINFLGEEAGMFDGLVPGDIINLSLNSQGRINHVKKITINNEITNYHGAIQKFLRGNVVGIDSEVGMVKIKHGDITGTFRLASTKTVLFYDKKTNKCESKTAAQLQTGDEVVIRLAWGVIEDIACFE